MTSIKRAGRLPALLLTLAIVAAAALALTLSAGGDSTAAPAAKPAAPASAKAPAKHAAKPATTKQEPAAKHTTTNPSAFAEPGDSPVQMYIDDTGERRGQLIHDYDTCLLANGAKENTTRAMAVFQGTGVKPVVIQEPVPAAASKACEAKLPLLPKEEDPSLNPHYAAQWEANVQCLRDHGVAVHTIPDHSVYPNGLGWTYDNDHAVTPDNEADLERSCEIAAFS